MDLSIMERNLELTTTHLKRLIMLWCLDFGLISKNGCNHSLFSQQRVRHPAMCCSCCWRCCCCWDDDDDAVKRSPSLIEEDPAPPTPPPPSCCRIILRRHFARAFWNQTFLFLEKIILRIGLDWRQGGSKWIYLKDALGESRLLCQLFEIFGIGILIDGEVGFHCAQLMMFERRSHSFGSLRLLLLWRRSTASSSSVTSATRTAVRSWTVVHHPFHRR